MNIDDSDDFSENNEYEDEENDSEYNYDENDDGFAGLGASAIDRPMFSEDTLKYAKSMSASPYKADIINHIKQLPITQRYKDAWYSCIYTLFSEEQVLANNNPRKDSSFTTRDPLGKNIIFAQRNIELTRCESTKPDTYAVNVAALEKYVLSVYEAYVSRSIGDKRERIINSELSTRSITQSEVINRQRRPQQQTKKGFLGFGGRR